MEINEVGPRVVLCYNNMFVEAFDLVENGGGVDCSVGALGIGIDGRGTRHI